MDRFHEHLARLGLDAGGRYGLALAGGYAVQAHGFLTRPSEDVDLFTAYDSSQLAAAVDAVLDAYAEEGLDITVAARDTTFARIIVSDGRNTSKVEIVADMRRNEPVHLWIGPVLHPDDAVANKMGAFYDRGESRDFVDIHAAAKVGGYSRGTLVSLLATVQASIDTGYLAWRLGEVDRMDERDFAAYGIAGQDLDELRAWFADWRAELLAA